MYKRKIVSLASVFLCMCMAIIPLNSYGFATEAGQTVSGPSVSNPSVSSPSVSGPSVSGPDLIEPGDSESGILIEKTESDTRVIPDKYNTGHKGELTKVEIGTEVNGIVFVGGSNNTRHVLDFCYRNKEVEGTVYFENYDFSDYGLWSYNEDKVVDRKIKVVFNNCKFAGVSVGRAVGGLSFEFNNCTFKSFSGSNSVFNRCKFGQSYSDGIVPYQNIEVNDCFFWDMGGWFCEKEVHTDGTQIYGIKDLDVTNVNYNNCRFEVIPLPKEGSKAYVNACIMLQLEFSNAKDVHFSDCIVNGGGYSIYVSMKRGNFTFEDVDFDGIRFGCANKYGIFYKSPIQQVKINDVSATDSLYIGSVWRGDGETHLSVTNDTSAERKLQMITKKGIYTCVIPACPLGGTLTTENTYQEMPFDLDVVLPEECEYVVCYDTTIDGAAKQIRYINWSDHPVYLAKSVMDDLCGGEADILLEGSCGKTITFTLTKSGVLTLTGTGATYNYHSQKNPPWWEYIDFIKEIRIEEGIEGLGSMLFRKCSSVEAVSLPDSLKSIGQYAFGGCVSLNEFTIPANVEVLGRNMLSGTPLQDVYYEGDDWNQIEVSNDNDTLHQRVVYYEDGKIRYRLSYVLNDTEAEPATHNNPIKYDVGSAFSFNTPQRAGYTFEGWYTDEEFTVKTEGITTSDKGNKTLYAKWNKIASSAQGDDTKGNSSVKPNDGGNMDATVAPKKVKGLKVKKKSKTSLKISWKRDKSVSGYQIAMKAGSKGKYKIVKTIKKNKTVSFTKKKLKKGKTYYIKVRAYKKVNGKKIYGAYSKAKKIKLK